MKDEFANHRLGVLGKINRLKGNIFRSHRLMFFGFILQAFKHFEAVWQQPCIHLDLSSWQVRKLLFHRRQVYDLRNILNTAKNGNIFLRDLFPVKDRL